MQIKKNRGFSLVEILIVIGIIGILAGIGVPRYMGYKEKSLRAECLSYAPAIMKDAQMFYTKVDFYPCRLDEQYEFTQAGCGVANQRAIKFPFMGVTAAAGASEVNYFYTVKPSNLVVAQPDQWFPDVGANAIGATPDFTHGLAVTKDFSAAPYGSDVVVICGGRIKPSSPAGQDFDELVLLDNGEFWIFNNELTGFHDANGEIYH